MNDASPPPHGSRWPRAISWSVTVLAAVAIVWFATSLLRSCVDAPRATVEELGKVPERLMKAGGAEVRATLKAFRDVLKPSAPVLSPLVVLRGEDSTPKLVVYTHMVDVAIDLVEDHWYGDTYSRVEAKNCRVQFIVAIDRMTDADVIFLPGQEGEPARIVVLAPRPRVDGEMLVIAPESIEFTERNTGVRYARSWFGLDNRDTLVRRIRPQLLEAVSKPELRVKAEQAARVFFETRFAEWLRTDLKLGRDVVIDLRWVDQ